MDMKLAENIRSFRKGRKLTQEQHAEVLGGTTGSAQAASIRRAKAIPGIKNRLPCFSGSLFCMRCGCQSRLKSLTSSMDSPPMPGPTRPAIR